MKLQISAITMTLTILCGNAFATSLPGPVVDTAWLSKNLAEVQVVDVRSNAKSFITQAEFETDKKTGKKTLVEVGGHIPGAVFVPFKAIRADRMENGQKLSYMLPEKAAFEKLMQTSSLVAGKPIVLVSASQNALDVDEALRLYWQLKYFGEDQVAVLNGGMAAWLAEGRDVVVTPAPVTAGNWKATAERKELVATSEDVASAEHNKVQLVDARNGAQFLGLGKREYVSAFGHIKGAHLVTPDVLFKNEGPAVKFYSADTYRSIYTMSGIQPDAPSVAYCNSGHLAAGPWFIQHELLGNQHVQLYDGSMHKWTLEKRPVESVAVAAMPATCSVGANTPGC